MATTVQSLPMASMAASIPVAQTTLSQPSGLRVPAGLPPLRSRHLSSSLSEAAAPLPLAGSSGRGPRRTTVTSRAASAKTAYICRDCGYIYNDRKPFESLSNDYSCPVCAAPKRRFKPYDAPVAKNANSDAIRKSRKADLKAGDAAMGSALPVATAVGLAALLGTFLYLNSQY